jgi:hypothetical protein
MDEIIERVAIAIYAQSSMRLAWGDDAQAWAADRENVRESFRAQARAAIAAMQQETP